MMRNNRVLSQIDFSIDTINKMVSEYTPSVTDKKPVIGISTNHNHIDENTLTHTYVDSVRHAGGIPMIIPLTTDVDLLYNILDKCDGLIMSGGGDIHSLWWGEEPNAHISQIDHGKDYFDLLLVKMAIRKSLPILGICRGLQLINVALGGTLIQDLPTTIKGINHNQTATRYEVWHPISVSPNSRLFRILGSDHILVNSFHHQAVGKVAPSGTLSAYASDGTIEAVDFYPEHNALGVQWHPEALACDGEGIHCRLFSHLVTEANLYRQAVRTHQQFVTIDSHVDTPSILVGNPCAENIEPKVRYNGMVTGGLDLVFMAAFVAQGSDSPFEQVIAMLNAIDALAEVSEGKIRVINNLSAVMSAKSEGIKMICKAVENGYAIGDDLHNLKLLADKGVKYITLCHNGDNQICDSAVKSTHTHSGLSSFGVEVVREMNRLNIVVDVSHASDETIAQVLEVSTQPIIASHSSCRALYNHPRNIPDHLLKAIASKGGVVQVCMYHGFLKESGATISSFADHVEHCIKTIGADHVGIGTDFDGGGEVIGCRDTSALHRVTIELLRRGLAIKQLEGLWGSNLLKVMS